MSDVVYGNYVPILTKVRDDDYDEFIKKYEDDQKCCPMCGSDSHKTTYSGYILDMCNMNDYKDLNTCICNDCGGVHKKHDRVKMKSEVKDV